MKGGFDLYGNYYPNLDDALNAEMAQCNEIDNRINDRRIKDLEWVVQQQQLTINMLRNQLDSQTGEKGEQ